MRRAVSAVNGACECRLAAGIAAWSNGGFFREWGMTSSHDKNYGPVAVPIIPCRWSGVSLSGLRLPVDFRARGLTIPAGAARAKRRPERPMLPGSQDPKELGFY